MSINAMTQVWDHSASDGSTMLLLLLAIADQADDCGRSAFSTIESLARRTRQSPRNVIRIIQNAEALHELKIERHSHQPNRYTLTPGGRRIDPKPVRKCDKLSPPNQNEGDKLSPRGDKQVPQMSPIPYGTHGFHDDDDASLRAAPVDDAVDSEQIERAVQIVSRLNAAGVEGTNRQRLAALWSAFDDGLEIIGRTCETTATEAVAGNDGRGAKIRNMSGLTVKRLREAWEVRTGQHKASWEVADQRLITLAKPISEHAIARRQFARQAETNEEGR